MIGDTSCAAEMDLLHRVFESPVCMTPYPLRLEVLGSRESSIMYAYVVLLMLGSRGVAWQSVGHPYMHLALQ